MKNRSASPLPGTGSYYIMYNPSTVDLMGKIGDEGFTAPDIVEYLTGKKIESCDERNYDGYLGFDPGLRRRGMLEQLGIESYGSYYIANQISAADPAARVILADDARRTMAEIIRSERCAPSAVFMTTMSSNFPAACAAAMALNRARIPVIIGGIHVSTGPRDIDTYLRAHVPHPGLVSRVIGAGDSAVMKKIVNDVINGSLKPEYRGSAVIENGVWGGPRVIALPRIRPRFIDKLPVAGPVLSRMIDTNVSTPFLGCPFSCSFCSISSIPKKDRKFRARSADDFLAELMANQKNGASFRNRFYFITPDNLLVGGPALVELLDRMIDSPLKINYAAQISIEIADNEKLLRKLRLSGASHFFIGLESLDIRNLEYVGKNIVPRIKKEGTSVDEFYSSRIKRILDQGISVHGAFMFGMPHDYFNSMDDHTGRDIAEFCVRNRIGLQPTCLSYLPGSLDFIEGEKSGGHAYGNPGAMDYFCSLSVADLTESNRRLPETLRGSPLVAFYCVHDAIRRVGSWGNAIRFGYHMAKKSWKSPTAKGLKSLSERATGSFAGMGFQLGVSTYLELYDILAQSTDKVQGTYERLYSRERDPEIKSMFENIVDAYRA